MIEMNHIFTTTMTKHVLASVALMLITTAPTTQAAEGEDHILKPGQFPPPNSGTYLAGALVFVDPINRRGGLRLDGDPGGHHNVDYFAMLPYGIIWYNGTPAELRAIPIGTHVHGYFYLPPVGEEKTIPPLPESQQQYTLKRNHAISLEDDFSFYQRRGQAWKGE